MTSHELAKKLLDMPDLPVVVQDGMDPSDPKLIQYVEISKSRYWDGTDWNKKPHILLE